jgi:signal transduction histidine kinase
MKSQLNLRSVLGDLDLIESTIDISDIILSVYNIFGVNKKAPGVILIKNGHFYGLLSKVKFFEVMSKQFMYDLYSKRKIEVFFDESSSKDNLILNSSTTILEATNLAVTRSESNIFEPIIVRVNVDDYRILDFYELLIAQNKIQAIMNDLLKQANDFKNEVLAITAHDLRNPISVILGFSSLILDGNNIDNSKDFVQHIQKAATQMEDLVSSFLATTINDSLEFKIEYSHFEICDLIQSVVDGFKLMADKKKQKIIYEDFCDPEIITSDKLKIKEITENLISNAIKYSEREMEIRITLQKEGQYIIIKIKDQGPGFSESDLKNIFGKFQRLSARPTGDESSTGLGLFITKTIIAKLNGSINLASTPGIGTTFTVKLPVTLSE